MLLGQTPKSILPKNENLISYLLQSGQYAQAYELLIATTKQKATTSGLVNLALCLIEAEEYSQALVILDQAQNSLTLPLNQNKLKDNTYLKLDKKQNRTTCYKATIISEQVDLFPDLVYENILRLKVDCFLLTKQWKSLLKIANGLRSKKYMNVDEAICLAEQNLKNETI